MTTSKGTVQNAIDAKMAPYVAALGRVAHSWNYLQEALGQLFCGVTGLESVVGEAIWHSTTNDRAQREMLRAAIMASTQERLAVELPKAKDDIKWLLDRADSVAEQRNTAIHAPMSLVLGNKEIELHPLAYHGNPRARKLVGKDILTEFDWYEKCADALTDFARAARRAIAGDSAPWPEKPQMPRLQQRKNKPLRHKSDAELDRLRP